MYEVCVALTVAGVSRGPSPKERTDHGGLNLKLHAVLRCRRIFHRHASDRSEYKDARIPVLPVLPDAHDFIADKGDVSDCFQAVSAMRYFSLCSAARSQKEAPAS